MQTIVRCPETTVGQMETPVESVEVGSEGTGQVSLPGDAIPIVVREEGEGARMGE